MNKEKGIPFPIGAIADLTEEEYKQVIQDIYVKAILRIHFSLHHKYSRIKWRRNK